jgi:hypothetical protein
MQGHLLSNTKKQINAQLKAQFGNNALYYSAETAADNTDLLA